MERVVEFGQDNVEDGSNLTQYQLSYVFSKLAVSENESNFESENENLMIINSIEICFTEDFRKTISTQEFQSNVILINQNFVVLLKYVVIL